MRLFISRKKLHVVGLECDPILAEMTLVQLGSNAF